MTAERIFDQLLEASLLLQDDLTRSMAALGLTVTKTHLLWHVAQNGASTQQQIATELGVSPRHVTGLVDALEADGFAHRRPHPRDRRAFLVALSPKGDSTMTTMREQRSRDAARLVADLPAASVDELTRSLDTVLVRLRELVAAAGDDSAGPR